MNTSKEESLVTFGINAREISGLITNENYNQKEIEALMNEYTKYVYSLEEIFGDYC